MSSSTGAPHAVRAAMRWLERKFLYSAGFGVIVLLGVGLGLYYWSARAASADEVVRIGYPAGSPVRRHFLEQLSLRGKARGLDIRLVETGGADQTLSLIDQGVTDLGLITGAVEDHSERRVFEIAPLYMEPLQLLVRASLYDAVSRDFGQLRGRTIGLDGLGTSTNLLATELLRFIGLEDSQTGALHYTPLHIPQAQYPQMKADGAFPDAIFQIGGIPSPGVRSLITLRDYRLVPLPFGGAFNLDKFRADDSSRQEAGERLRLNRAFVEEFVIPAFTYSVLPAVPPTDTRTVGSRLILIGREHLDERVAHRILDLILTPEIASLADPDLTVDVLKSSFQFQRHPATDTYLTSLEPVDVEGAFVAYARMVEVWGLIITLYIAASKGLKAWKNRQAARKGAVADFLKEVLAVEAEAGPACTHAERIALDQRLSDIKKASIELHLDGRLEDAEELPYLLAMLADTRTRIWGAVS